jgi:predicted NBD/HSP70 family sugar kinase
MANNADAACLHETWSGVAKEIQNMVYFMVGEGVGAGILIDGVLYEGHNKKAGEIGHTSVNIFGPRCVCGNQGCLEMYCSTQKILEKAREAAWFGESTFLHQLLTEKRNDLKFHHIIEGARNEDTTCQNILKQLGQYISVGIINLLNVFDPEIIVIGGEATLAKDFIEEPIRRGIEERLLYRDYVVPQVHFSEWGDDIRLLGAASVVLDHFMAGELGRF